MKRGLVLSILVLVLVISACQGGGKGKGPKQTTFIGGTSGLDVAFAEDQPPDNVLDNNQEKFFITLLVKNAGEYSIPAGGVISSLSGIDQNSFSIKDMNKKNLNEIFSASNEGGTVMPGAEELIEFGEAGYSQELPGPITFNIKADICYNYQTKSVSKVCVRKNVLQKGMGDVCIINNNNIASENSGAPVHVTNVRENAIGGSKIKIAFKIKNNGVGKVYAPGTFSNSCLGGEDGEDKVKVTLSNPQNNFKVECAVLGNKNSGIVNLINKERDVSCIIDTGNLQDITYEDSLFITLDYVYRTAVTTPIRVVNSI